MVGDGGVGGLIVRGTSQLSWVSSPVLPVNQVSDLDWALMPSAGITYDDMKELNISCDMICVW